MSATGTAREESQSMEFSVTKSALLNELNTTQGVVERKTTIPILSNLLVEARDARVIITATDLELSVRTSCEARVKKEGAGTIPAKKLLELVRLLPEGEIKFKLLDNHWVEIVSDKKKCKLVGMAKENFPALPAMPHVAANPIRPSSVQELSFLNPSVPAFAAARRQIFDNFVNQETQRQTQRYVTICLYHP